MTSEQFVLENERLNSEIEHVLTVDNTAPFLDGPFNAKEYFENQPKILWLMKEAHGEPFSYPELFTKNYQDFIEKLVFGRHRHTWQPVVYISFSILNGFLSKSQMGDIKKNLGLVKALNKVAWVNINKRPSEQVIGRRRKIFKKLMRKTVT